MPIVSSACPRIGSITSFVVVSYFSRFEIVVLNINLFLVILGMETDAADVEIEEDKAEVCEDKSSENEIDVVIKKCQVTTSFPKI